MDYIRNVCILAHVDHGKTSLADVIISSNGVISQRSAGDLRFMDSTMDEQQRGITMKSSAISLTHQYYNKLKGNSEEKKKYFINLIDSPGHVDFSGEVSTAVKISDNAFILVDVLEGVCPQTRTVLTQAWKEGLNFVLVLNKIDKLHIELKLSTTEAYVRLSDIIQDVHHLIGELISHEVKEEEEKHDLILSKECIAKRYDTLPFHPLKGRVIFCSAFHHWGFRISDFIDVYSKPLDIDKQELYKKMWGDFYLNGKKNILKGAIANDKKNIFTSLILDQIWSIYNALELNDVTKVITMMSKLNIKVMPKKQNSESASQISNIRHVFNSWMPLCTVLLDTLIEKCPNPRAAITEKKLKILVPNDKFFRARDILRNADTSIDVPMVTFISKVMLQNNNNEEFSSKELIAFGRIYSGFMKPGMKVFLFSPRFNPYKVDEKFLNLTAEEFDEGSINVYEEDYKEEASQLSDVYIFKVKELFLFVGNDTLRLGNGISAGHIIGMTGLDWHTVHKNGAVMGNCCISDCLGMFSQYDNWSDDCNNIICVSIEPKISNFLHDVEDALRLLEKADPIVDIKILHSGEMLLYAAGEIHLQKCLNDLQTRIIPHIELDISPPIVPFRETILHRSTCNLPLFASIEALSQELKEIKSNVLNIDDNIKKNPHHQGIKESVVESLRLPQKCGTKLCVNVSVHSLPKSLIQWIEINYSTFFRLIKAKRIKDELSETDIDEKEHLYNSLKVALQEATKEENEMCTFTDVIPIDYDSLLEQFWTIGDSQSTQCNVLFSYIGQCGIFTSTDVINDVHDAFYLNISTGFQRALKSGPICQEPIKNVAFIVHGIWEMSEETVAKVADNDSYSDDEEEYTKVKYNFNFSMDSFISSPGQLSNSITKGCQVALISHPGARLMIATYKLELEIRINMFKNLNSIIKQLHGSIVQQELNVGNFLVEAHIPVIESFGFGDKLRKKTSGEVSLPQLKTVIWEILDCSPLLENKIYSTITDNSNNCDIGISQELVTRTQNYVVTVKAKKGLGTRKQIVECGDKQRTLNKKK